MLEQRVIALEDPGREFFCANDAWFSIKLRLAELLGVWRLPQRDEGAEQAAILAAADSFEVAFARLNPLLPPCRNCGCVLFEPLRGR